MTVTSRAACASSSHSLTDGAGASDWSGIPIVIKNFAFSPADLTVSPGGKVTVRYGGPATLARSLGLHRQLSKSGQSPRGGRPFPAAQAIYDSAQPDNKENHPCSH
jgi:hypothetical protein